MCGGGEYNREQVIVDNIPLVVTIAREAFSWSHLPLADRVQAGCLGLIRAAQGFDPSRCRKFSTYAEPWIKQSISRTINRDHPIRIPCWAVTEVNRKAGNPRGRRSTRDLAAGVMGMRRGELDPDMVPVSDAREIDALDDAVHARSLVGIAMGSLFPQEREAFRLRYGLDGGPARSIREVAAAMGITLAMARAILRDGLRAMRVRLEQLD